MPTCSYGGVNFGAGPSNKPNEMSWTGYNLDQVGIIYISTFDAALDQTVLYIVKAINEGTRTAHSSLNLAQKTSFLVRQHFSYEFS